MKPRPYVPMWVREGPIPDPPPWEPRNAAAIKAWTEEHLARRFLEWMNRTAYEFHAGGQHKFDPETHEATITHYTYEDCIAIAKEATKDDDTPMEPLREYLRKEGRPELVEFINPSRERGDRRHTPNFAVKHAKEDVKFIRHLWFQTYGIQRRRPDNLPDLPSAEDIAAEFRNVVLRSNKSRR